MKMKGYFAYLVKGEMTGYKRLFRAAGTLLVVTLFLNSAVYGQGTSAAKKDTILILIANPAVQLEATQALNDLYNFDFEKAALQFGWFKQKYRWHPLPYFMVGLAEWWKIMPNTKSTLHDDRFLAYMDSTIMVAENLHKKSKEYRIEAAFFLSAAHGFKARLFSDEERKNWGKAAASGKIALKYLEECKEYDDLSPELLFGDALYNYFSVWVPDNYPALKPLLWFFPKGDKALGLQQLKEVSYNAFYTRTEAMVWLMRILNSYENDQVRALQIAEYLNKTYPNNPYFHRYYARMLYARGMYPDLEKQCESILARIDSGMMGYEATSGRYAAFFMGQIHESKRHYEEAKKYYKMAIRFSEQVGATDSGYYFYSLIALGEIADKQGNQAEAKKYFKEVKGRAGRKNEAFKDAKKRLKNLEKGD
jgi:tetratricopeptide (TPR) repeat protein